MLAKLLIRPSRELYKISDLGPEDFILSGKVFTREDLTLLNSRNLRLQCSWFKPKFSSSDHTCIVYCHGNCGSRKDALEIAKTMLPLGYTVFAFDFAGSGLSDGELISLGYYESWDIKCVVEHIRKTNENIILWGRSMGASAAILYASCDPKITLCVLDSPFTSLKKVLREFFGDKSWLKNLLQYFSPKIRKDILKIAKFDIYDVNPLKFAKLCKMPTILIHGLKDNLVSVQHSHKIFKELSCDKYLLELGGGHNSWRAANILERVEYLIRELLERAETADELFLETEKANPPSFSVK